MSTVLAIIMVFGGSIALYFLRKENVRSNGQFIELADHFNRQQYDDDLDSDPIYDFLPGNIWHSLSED